MLTTISNKSVVLTQILLNVRTSYCSIPKKIDLSHVYRAKPEDIPEGIWAGDKHPNFTDVEEVKGYWHYVERLFPKLRVPDPPQKLSSTGWKAPAENLPDLPYYVKRSRNYMLPVYLTRMYEDKILVTRVKYVHGDIWVLENELKTYLEEKLGEAVESNVTEMACYVNFKGDHVEPIKEWLYDKGF